MRSREAAVALGISERLLWEWTNRGIVPHIRLGKATMRQAEAVKVKVEQLVLAATGVTGVIDDETANWLTGLDDSMYDKLAGIGLVGRRESMKLRAFLEAYIAERRDVKPDTAIVYRQVTGNLTGFFGDDKPLREITPGEVDQWRLYLVGLGLADNTVRRRCGVAKQFFRVAVRRKLVSSNPFEDLKAAPSGSISSRRRRRKRFWMPARMLNGDCFLL